MNKMPVRRFTISDAIVLIAATAAGLAWLRGYVLVRTWPELIRPDEGWSAGPILVALARVLYLSQFLLAAWSLAVLALRLRRPRPRLRHLALQPGSVVCIVAVLGMVSGALQLLAKTVAIRLIMGENIWAADPNSPEPVLRSAPLLAANLIWKFVISVSDVIALPLISAWFLLAWGRRCRPEPSWVDRAGRILGVLWIAAALGDWYLNEVMVYVPLSNMPPLPPPPPVPPPPPLPPLPP